MPRFPFQLRFAAVTSTPAVRAGGASRATRAGLAAFLAIAGLQWSVPQPAHAQVRATDTAAEAPTTTLTPFAAIGRNGTYWESEGYSVWPGFGPSFGATLRHERSGRRALELLGAFSATDYSMDFPTVNVRGTGSIHLYRLLAGLVWRTREGVDGYFSAGAGGVYYNPRDRVRVTPGDDEPSETLVPFTDDPAQLIPSAYVGAGLDLSADAHTARFDLRLLGSRALQDIQTERGSVNLEPRVTFEVLFSVGYVFDL